mmetsp:Transcript_1280/g.2610  ORF Transcript_1280/g.2610 Transcript_1280/m.2610 type:complete len:280 (-) Transcript_1280:182-1021(-)
MFGHVTKLLLFLALSVGIICNLLLVLGVVCVIPEVEHWGLPLNPKLLLKDYSVSFDAGVHQVHGLGLVHRPDLLVLVRVCLFKVLELELKVLVLLRDTAVLVCEDIVLVLELLVCICILCYQATEHVLQPCKLPLVVLYGLLVLFHPLTQHSQVVFQLLSIELVQRSHLLQLLFQTLNFFLQLHFENVVLLSIVLVNLVQLVLLLFDLVLTRLAVGQLLGSSLFNQRCDFSLVAFQELCSLLHERCLNLLKLLLISPNQGFRLLVHRTYQPINVLRLFL